jgi:hypothetical protein
MPRYRVPLDLYLEAEDATEVEHVIFGMADCFDYNTPHFSRRGDIVELPEEAEEE